MSLRLQLFRLGWAAVVSACALTLPVALWAQDSARGLIQAVRDRDVAGVRHLVEGGADVNRRQADGATALHWAAYLDDPELATLLVENGAEVDAANDHGVTPLFLACTNGSVALVDLLVNAAANPGVAVASGETVLMTCARAGSAAGVHTLLGHGAAVNARERVESQTALMWAVSRGHPDVVAILLEHGADVQARSRVRRQVISRRLQSELKYGELGRRYGTDAEETEVGGFTPILFAARQGSVESARRLLDAGANVNDAAPDGAGPLLIAAHSGHGELAAYLLERGANPNAAAAGYTALHAAVLTGDRSLVEALLAHGARPDAQVTLATRVTRNGQVLMLGEHLLGATPFALAAKYAEVDIMRRLAEAGADPRLPLKNGWTPLMLAAGASWRYGVWDRRDRALAKDPAFQAEHYDEAGTLAAVRLAVERGADVAARDADLNTPLHHVIDKGFDEVVSYLVARGAPLDAINARGLTPLDIVTRARTGNLAAAGDTAALLRTLAARTGDRP